MSGTKKKKKSTKKYKKLDTSKIIPIIAILEAIILVAVASYAWYFFSAGKELSSGIITVNADSGLEIDFLDADKSTYIDIFDYIDKDKFAFEPATSVDGRNIYFPTSGTFGNTDTSLMVFRDGTANDVNSKYIDIDFELTNTTGRRMDVYLSNKSSFTINDGRTNVNGKALRLAFYNNDGVSGDVTSTLISNHKKTSPTVAPSEGESEPPTEDDDTGTHYYYENWTVYFNNLSDKSNWSSVKAYVWHAAVDPADEAYITQWPGDAMVKVSGNLYSYTFKNRYELDGSGNKINYYYDRIAFNNGSNGANNQTVDLTTLANGHLYTPTSKNGSNYWNCSNTALTMTTIYFLKPDDWVTPACKTSSSAMSDLSSGYAMTQVTPGIYSFSFPNTDTYIRFVDNADSGRKSLSDASVVDNKLYYFPTDGVSGSVFTVDYSTSSIYFYNSLGWRQPYAYVNAFADDLGKYTYAIPMIALSGDLYYCNLATAYLKDKVHASTATYTTSSSTTQSVSALEDNCKVFFADSASVSTDTDSDYANRSFYADCYSEHVYRMLNETSVDPTGSVTRFKLDDENYLDEVNITEDSYAVISPGVSAGFQRPANPVNKIDYTTGAVQSIIPAFASSFDDFIIGSGNPVFSINSGDTVNMSMIIWLEGTDAHCTGENYAGKNINLYLEFSTFFAGDKIEGTYTYRFIDETEQHWTCNTITNKVTGVTVSPVMQLYDVTLDRGYLMEAVTPTTYAGEEKVKVWECVAPQALVTRSDFKNHVIEFRRVNPYDETEIWNRWEAGDPHTYSLDALKDRVVSFTAFADGSPDPGLYAESIDDLPVRSCGGLWGTYDTEILTVYDGRKSRSIGTLNFGYTYTYPASGETVKIEYKSSGYRNLAHDEHTGYSNSDGTWFNNFYSIVIPSTLFTNGSSSYFRNYTGVNGDYAINSTLNKDIEVSNTWSAGAVKGSFYELNDYNGVDHSYWGSDVLYIQGEHSLSVSYSSASDKCVMMCKFYDHEDEADAHYYSYLYDDDNYKGTFYYGYVAVVPCDKEYDSYKVQRYRTGDTSEATGLTRQAALVEHITPSTTSGRTKNIIAADPSDAANDRRIRKLDWDYKIIYFNDSGWNYPGPVIRVKNDSYAESAGTNTLKSIYGHTIYSYMVRSDSLVQFRYNSTYSIEFSTNDGYDYYPKGWKSSQFDVGGDTVGLSDRNLYGNGDSNTSPDTYINSSHFDNHYNNNENSGWPEYIPPNEKL